MKKIFLCVIVLIFSVKLSAQIPGIDVYHEILVEDLAGGSKVLVFGLDSTATDGIDAQLGESDLPPFPPAGAFEARLLLPPYPSGTLSSYSDFRQAVVTPPYSGVKEHRMKYQVGTGTVIKITWNLPPDVTGLLQDLFGGIIVNVPMSGSGNYTVTNLGIDQLKMFITYNNTIPVELTSFGASVNGSTVILNWQTSSEVNNRGFEVQRKSENSSWEKIGFVDGAGTSSNTRSYSFIDPDIIGTSSVYVYRLKQIDFNGDFRYSNEVEVDLTLNEYLLYQNYPNPFNPSTIIRFSVPKESFVTVKVYDLIGQEIASLFSGNTNPGTYTLNWNGKDNYGNNVSSGSYICKMTAGDFSESRKMIFIK
ncbi:MAG: hypothetical protein A2W11_14565 [Ignavibacteria bacterium RBG_16_35_7]|nr:MAG: hypothetical protein A2W11_14565 [Ignavibacteria bacterium RBG_16_35_7]